ncbi:MAG: hypothetical protein HRU19_16485 [Pseudobacteriovorax sp.]|nr:hypothetical protein [Pseudobacteriovorax sp.]
MLGSEILMTAIIATSSAQSTAPSEDNSNDGYIMVDVEKLEDSSYKAHDSSKPGFVAAELSRDAE